MKFNFAILLSSIAVLSGIKSTVGQSDRELEVFKDESQCHKELYKKCGEPLNKLKDAIEEVSVLGIITSAFETASCLTENISDITKACTGHQSANEVEKSKDMDLVSDLRGDDESRCHKALYDICGDELAALRKAIKDTSPNGIVGASLELAGCITIDFVKLVKACSPFKSSKLELSQSNSNIHFDFYDCVEMAKHQIQNEEVSGKINEFHDHYHPRGFHFFFIVFIIISVFIKGFLVGKGISYCQKKSNTEEIDNKEVSNGVPLKESKIGLLA